MVSKRKITRWSKTLLRQISEEIEVLSEAKIGIWERVLNSFKPDFGSSRLVKTLRPLSGPLPRGKAVQVKACENLAAFALSRRRIRYSGVAKDAAFGPKWWPTIFVPRSLALWEAGLKGERGLRAPRRRLRPSSRHGGFQNCRGNASSTTAQEWSTIGRKRRRHRRHCSHRPNRPTVGSRPRT